MKCLTSCLAHPWNKTGILKKTNESENWLLRGYTFLLLMLCNCQGTAGKVVRMSWLHWRLDLGVFFYDGVLKIMADCSSCVQCVRDAQDLFMEECFLPTVIEKNLSFKCWKAICRWSLKSAAMPHRTKLWALSKLSIHILDSEWLIKRAIY